MNIAFAVTLLLVHSTLASELNRTKKQINFGSDNEKEGYFYDKPTISFELPTRRPTTSFVASSTTVAPVPTGYNYPKPSIKFEEKPRVEIEVQKPASFGVFGSGGSTITSNVNRYDTFKPNVAINEQKTTVTSKVPTGGISGFGQTSVVSNVNKFEYIKPKIDITTSKPASQSSFGIFGSGGSTITSNVNRYDTFKPNVAINGQKTTFTSKVPTGGISGFGQTSVVSNVNKFEYIKPKIDITTSKPASQSSFGIFGGGSTITSNVNRYDISKPNVGINIQKTTSQSTFTSKTPSIGISGSVFGSGQSSYDVSNVNKYDFTKSQPAGQTSFGIFGSGGSSFTSNVNKPNEQKTNTFTAKFPSVGLTGNSQTSFNRDDVSKFGIGINAQKTNSQTTFTSKLPSVGISGGGQTSVVSNVNKYEYSKPKIEFNIAKPTSKPSSQSSFGIFGSGGSSFTSNINRDDTSKFGVGINTQKSTSTFTSQVPSVGKTGNGQTSFISTVNKYDYKKPAIKFEIANSTPKSSDQSSFSIFGSGGSTFDNSKAIIGSNAQTYKPSIGIYGTGVQKTTSQSSFSSQVPSGGISGSGKTSFVSTFNKYDQNKPKIEINLATTSKPIGQSSFGGFGTGVQKTTYQSTFGSKVPSGGISGGGQTSFVSSFNQYEQNKPKIEINLATTAKPIGQSSFGGFGTGVQKPTYQSTSGFKVPSGGISGSGQTSFVSTFNQYDQNKPKIEINLATTAKPISQSSFGGFGTGVQKTTSQSNFGSQVASGGISGSGQTSFVSTFNKYDQNKPKIEINLATTAKPIGQSSFGGFGTGVQKTTYQSTFGSKVPSGGKSGSGQTSFVSSFNQYDQNKVTTSKPIGQSSFGVFGTGVQKTTYQSTSGSKVPSGGISGSGQTSFVSTFNQYDQNKPKIEINLATTAKPIGQSSFGGFGTGVQKTTYQSTLGSKVPSGGKSGSGQTSFVSSFNQYDQNKVTTSKPIGQSSFGVFGTGVQKTTYQSTSGSKVPSGGISGSGQTSFISTFNQYEQNKPKIEINLATTAKPIGQSSFGGFGTGVQKTTYQSTFGSKVPSGGKSGSGQTSFVSSFNQYDQNKVTTSKPIAQSSFGVFGTGVQKTTYQSTSGSKVPSGGISGSGQTSFISTFNQYEQNKPKIEINLATTAKPIGQSLFGGFGTGVQKTTYQSTFGSKVPSGGISGSGQTSFVSSFNQYDQNKVTTSKPIGQSSFGVFGTGVQKTTYQSNFGSKVPSGGISGSGQTSFVSTFNQYEQNKPKIEINLATTAKPIGQSSFGVFGTGVQKTTYQSTFGSKVPSGGISGSGQTSFVSSFNQYDQNKVTTSKPIGQSSFGVFGTGAQKTTYQSTSGSKVPSGGISGSGQTSFVSSFNQYEQNKPKIEINLATTAKPIGQSLFGGFGTGVQKTTYQSTFGSKVPSGGISGSGQTSFVSSFNQYDQNKVTTSKPIGQSSFGVFGTGAQKTTYQSTSGSKVPSGGISGSGQTSFVSSFNQYEQNKPKIEINLATTAKPIGQSLFGGFGTGVQKTTYQSTFGSKVPSGGISGSGQTSFVSSFNQYDQNKVTTSKPISQSSFGVFGTGVQKTTYQSTSGSKVPSGGISGSGQTSFVSTFNQYDQNKPKIEINLATTAKPIGQSSFGGFGTGVQKTTYQSTSGSKVPSGGISGSGQTSFVSTFNKYDQNKPKIEINLATTAKPIGQSSFGGFGTGVQKTTYQSTFGSKVPSGGISGSGQTSFVSSFNQYDQNKVTTSKPIGQSSFGGFGTGVQKTTYQSTFGSKVPAGGISGSGQTSFVSSVNQYEQNKPKIEINLATTAKPIGQSLFGGFGTGVQKTTSQSTFGSIQSGGISGSGQTSFVSTFNKYDLNKPKIETDVPKQSSFGIFGSGGSSLNTQKTTSTFSSKFPSTGSGQTSVFSNVNKFELNKPQIGYSTSKPTGGSSVGIFGTGSGSQFGSNVNLQSSVTSKVSGFDYSTQRPSTNAPEYLPPLGSTFQKVKYSDDIKYF